jgi:hypothetical protein
MKDTITLPAHLNADRFGCEAPFFTEHVRGKALRVFDYLHPFYFVKVEGEYFSVHARDLQARYDGLPEFITNGKDNINP